MHAATLFFVLPLALAKPGHVARAEPAPLLQPQDAPLVAGQYIVKMKNDVPEVALEDTMSLLSDSPDHIYRAKGFNGFAAKLDAPTLNSLQNNPHVRSQAIIIGRAV